MGSSVSTISASLILLSGCVEKQRVCRLVIILCTRNDDDDDDCCEGINSSSLLFLVDKEAAEKILRLAELQCRSACLATIDVDIVVYNSDDHWMLLGF